MIEGLALLLSFAAILGTVVLVHELGHFVAARAGRVRIKELGIGLPPRMARLGSLLGTEVILNWVPLGGYVRPEGEFDASVRDGLAASRPLVRIGILGAGSLANAALSVVLMTAAFMLGWPDQVEVLAVERDSPAEAAGLLPGDQILSAGGELVQEAGQLRDRLDASRGAPVQLEIQRGALLLETTIQPRIYPPEGHGPAGFTSTSALVRYPLAEAAYRGIAKVSELIAETLRLTAGALSPSNDNVEMRLVSPLGLKQASDLAVRNSLDWSEPFPVLYLAAWLSLAVAMTNLLPLPALDGGRILVVLIEMIRSRRVEARIEKLVHAAGMVCLLALLLALTARDFIDPLF